ncbi:MAG: zinc-ribbon domain-containing protein [Oscillospiraceae bacterium]|nr:zinc-ribbon domain-containing protein [Oscillospiraceae bacterium]
MKFCTTCGAQLPDDATYCTSCGASLAAPVNRNISFKEYIGTYAEPTLVKNIKSSAIVCYVCLAISLIFAILYNYLGLIDVVVLGGLTLGMHLGKSKACAIALLVCSILSTLIALVSTGQFSGWLWIVASGWAVTSFSKLTKAYKAFQAGEATNAADMTL